MTPAMGRIIDELGREIIARKPELETEIATLKRIGTSNSWCGLLDEHFPIKGGWGIQPIHISPQILIREYPNV